MSFKKQFLKSKEICKVTFEISAEEAANADTINLVGEFNNWDKESLAFKKFKNGNFKLSLDLENGREFEFKYLVNGIDWQNDSQADGYKANGFGGENSVISTAV